MAHADPNIKQRFRIALAHANMTATRWAEVHGISLSHLYAVMAGIRVSRRISTALEAFIAGATERRISPRRRVERRASARGA